MWANSYITEVTLVHAVCGQIKLESNVIGVDKVSSTSIVTNC